MYGPGFPLGGFLFLFALAVGIIYAIAASIRWCIRKIRERATPRP